MMRRTPFSAILWRINLVGAGFCITLTVLFWIAGIKPHLKHHETRSALSQELASQQQNALQASSNIQNLQQQLDRVEHEIESNPIKLKLLNQLNERLDELSSLVIQCGLQINRVQPGHTRQEEHYQTLPIDLEGTGSYVQCTDLLSLLYKTFPDFGVASFELSSAATAGTAATLQLKLLWHARQSQGHNNAQAMAKP